MKVLITNLVLTRGTGTEFFVRDLVRGLLSQGIEVEVYCPEQGDLAEEVKSFGVNVAASIDQLKMTPDVIHGQHSVALDVFNKFPDVPALYFCHDALYGPDAPIAHPSVRIHVACNYYVLERVLSTPGVDPLKTQVIFNWVDPSRFVRKTEWNALPRNALVFSNYATSDNYYRSLADACESEGIALHGMGAELGNFSSRPEDVLPHYDIVFAKGKSAIEAMACGCSLIICDWRGLGFMVDSNNFIGARKYNFGAKNFVSLHDQASIVAAIKMYNPAEAKRTSELIVEMNGIDRQINEILRLYQQIINI